MSKTLAIEIFVYAQPCTADNVTEMLQKAGWSPFDADGRLHIWDSDVDEWHSFIGDISELTRCGSCMFAVFYGRQRATVYADGTDRFVLYPDAYAEKTIIGGAEIFNYNWYYNNLVNGINREKCVIERVSFTEYY